MWPLHMTSVAVIPGLEKGDEAAIQRKHANMERKQKRFHIGDVASIPITRRESALDFGML